MRGIGRALQGLESMGLPHWIVGFVFFGTVIAFLSYILKNAPLGRARGLVKRSVHVSPAQRTEMEREALAIVWDHPVGLLSVGQEAIQRDRRDLATRALARLMEIGKRPDDIRKLEDELYGKNRPRLEREVIAIRGLIEEELFEMAAARMKRALELWPGNEGLLELDTRLQERLWAAATRADRHEPPAA